MLDVIVTSTCRRTIERTLPSFLEKVSCSEGFRFIVNVDVKHKRYLPRLKRYLAGSGIEDVRFNMNPHAGPRGQSEAVNYLFARIESPYCFHLEDDWIFLKEIDLDDLIQVMKKNKNIHHIRFNKMRTKDYAWLYHLSDEDSIEFRKPNHNCKIDGIDLVRTHVWSFNPSIARTSVVKSLVPVPLDTSCEKYFCNRYDHMFIEKGTYIWGRIGDEAAVRDIGRNRLIGYLKLLKKRIKGYRPV